MTKNISEPRSGTDENESKEILGRYGIARPSFIVIREGTPLKDASRLVSGSPIPFPLVVKALGRDILHKTEMGAVVVGVQGPEDLERVLEGMRGRFPDRDLMVEEMVPHRVEFILGVSRDATFGHVIMFGAGGILSELYGDVAFRRLPLDDGEARRMIGSTRIGAVFRGYRGLDMDMVAMERALGSLSRLVADAGPGLSELDINPVVCIGRRAVALDAKMVFRGPEEGDAGLRDPAPVPATGT